jgi:hypothetical protein
MTSIKPPTPGATSPHPVTDAARSGAPDASGAASPTGTDADTFKSALERQSSTSAGPAGPAGATTAGSASSTGAASQLSSKAGLDPVSALVQQVESGRLTMDQAVEKLLEQTVSSLGAQLTSAQRAELSDVLRAALANDPTLQGLRGDAG